MSRAARLHLVSQLGAVLHAASRDMADMRDERSLQRCAWLIDIAKQLVNDLALQCEQHEQGACGVGSGKGDE